MSTNSEDVAKRIPPGQSLTTKWPVLTYGLTPKFNPKTWKFRCFGLVEEEVSWTWEELLALPRSEVFCDIHCVTRWSRLDNRFEGVHIREIMKRVRLKPEAKFVMMHADPDYTTNLPLEDLIDDDVVLALKHDGKDLEPTGGISHPMRNGRGEARMSNAHQQLAAGNKNSMHFAHGSGVVLDVHQAHGGHHHVE